MGQSRGQFKVSELGRGEERLAESRPGPRESADRRRARGEFAEEGQCAVSFRIRRRPGEGEPIGLIDPAMHRHARRPGVDRPAPRPARMTNGPLQEVKRLGRAGRRGPLAGDEARVGEVEQGERLEHPVPDHRQVDRSMRVGRVQTGDADKQCQALAGAGDGRADRRLRGEPAADKEHGVAQGLGIQPASAHPPDEGVVGIDLEVVRIVRRVEPVGPAEDDPADQPLDRPAVGHEIDGQGVE